VFDVVLSAEEDPAVGVGVGG